MTRWRRALGSWLLRGARRAETKEGEERDRLRDDSQSLGFAADLCRVLQEEISGDGEETLSLLDVGARTAAGSNLIAQIFHPRGWSSLKFRVTAIDSDPFWAPRAQLRYPDVRYRTRDVMDVSERYDVVICSHTLEHLEEPRPVLSHLLRLARRLVVIAGPWKEDPASSPPYHHFSFDETFFEDPEPSRFEIYTSPHWSGGDCFIAAYDRSGGGRTEPATG